MLSNSQEKMVKWLNCWMVWLNGWVFVYELSGYTFESSCRSKCYSYVYQILSKVPTKFSIKTKVLHSQL